MKLQLWQVRPTEEPGWRPEIIVIGLMLLDGGLMGLGGLLVDISLVIDRHSCLVPALLCPSP